MVRGQRLLTAARGGGTIIGNPFSDEFTNASTLVSRWDADAGDTFTLFKDIDDTVPGALYLQGQVYQVAPTPPFTVVSRVVHVDWDTGPGVGGIWINIAAGAPGPYFGAGVDVGTPGTMWWSGSKFNSSGAFTGNVNITHSSAGYTWAVPHQCRMTVNSDTDIDWELSFDDGGSFDPVITGYNPGFAINYIGLESGGARAGFDWFHVTY